MSSEPAGRARPIGPAEAVVRRGRVGATGTLPGMATPLAQSSRRHPTAASGGAPLCVLSVHAHPDDEASKGAATMARYAAEGVRTVLVTCTGGEAGDILNEEADSARGAGRHRRGAPARARRGGPASSATTRCYLLGYRDSGMPDTEPTRTPTTSPTPTSTRRSGRLVAIIRAERPQVIVTLLRRPGRRATSTPTTSGCTTSACWRSTAPRDPDWYPEAGDAVAAAEAVLLERLLAQPGHGDARLVRRPRRGEPVQGLGRTRMPADDAATRRPPASTSATTSTSGARRCSRTARRSRRPGSSSASRLEVVREIHPWEDFELARSLVDTDVAEGEYEHDLFAGVRVTTAS